MPSILVIGGTSDVGVALAQLYASKKYDVYLAGRNMQNLSILCEDLRIRFGIRSECYLYNALDTKAFEETISMFTILPDISFYVVGYLGNNEQALTDKNETESIISSNYTGAVAVLNKLALKYAEMKNGTIVGIGSVAGERGRKSNFIYGSANAGFGVYMNGLRNWLHAYNVHVLLVKPGFIQSKMTAEIALPKMLTSKPNEVARRIEKAVLAKKNTLYVKWYWRYIMLIIKMIPEPIFKKMNM